MRRVFIRDSRTFEQMAQAVHAAAFVEYTVTLRDGLNLGGGDYYSFASDTANVLLVHNDQDHAEVYVPEHADANFSIYVHTGDKSILDFVGQRIREAGIESFIAEESSWA